MGLAGVRPSAAAASGLPPGAQAAADAHRKDWQWLLGNWDVRHRRLKERLVGDTHWQEFAGKSATWSTLGGLGTIDDNLLEFPDGAYRGLSLRAFDAAAGTWAIWWLDGRQPTRIDPPVRGRFDADGGTFVGADVFKGRPIMMRFRWHDIHGARPWWEQAFSPDGGATWEVNWRNWFTRTAARPSPLPTLADAPRDWDFLAGRWNVRHRRLRQRFAGSTDWDEFGGTFVNWPVLGGYGNVGDNVMEFPGGTVRGVGFRAFDPASRQWLSWWLDGRSPAEIGVPLRGAFVDGVGQLVGADVHERKAIKTRVIWSRITERSARWEQAGSADDGRTWEVNWISDFERQA
ncbi:MAG: hypothetical protein J7520_11645 [Dokdonella sp.]|nr:hypothetical protein [Dokdonella sp.]